LKILKTCIQTKSDCNHKGQRIPSFPEDIQ
jgi:hypothetical protein